MKKINNNEFVKAKVRHHMTPGEALKAIRELQGITQTELAELTGMAQSHISAMERSSANIGCDRAMTLAKALHVHPAVILFPDFELDMVA